ALPQLGSVAQQARRRCAANILAAVAGEEQKPFAYLGKGMLAMVGRANCFAAATVAVKRDFAVSNDLDIANWGPRKETPVLAIELACAFIANFTLQIVGGGGPEQ